MLIRIILLMLITGVGLAQGMQNTANTIEEQEITALSDRILNSEHLSPQDFYLLLSHFKNKKISDIINDFIIRNKISALLWSKIPERGLNKIKEIMENSGGKSRKIYEEQGLGWLYDELEDSMGRNELLILINQNESNEKIIEKLNSILPKIYKKNLMEFSSIIFSDLPGTEGEEKRLKPYTGKPQAIKEVIYNRDGFNQDLSDLPADIKLVQGLPLVLEAGESVKDTSMAEEYKIGKDIPISYTIYLPESEIKGVIVKVYGGNGISNIKDDFRANGLIDLDRYCLDHGIIVIRLNLVDVLELNNLQFFMPEDIHIKLHASINKFFETLKYHPEWLSPDLVIPEKVKIALYGVSFGGRTAVRQAELYPNTFDGYISHDGAITSRKMGDRILLEHLAPMDPLNEKGVQKSIDQKIKNIKQPILLLHNYDDNNVFVNVTLDFYQCAIESGKRDLVQLLITRNGNPLPIYNPNKWYETENKGHGITNEEEAFQSYAGTIVSFILKGPSKFPVTSEWMAYQYKIYASKHSKEAPFEEKFISEAYRLYQERYYRPLVQSATQTFFKPEEFQKKVLNKELLRKMNKEVDQELTDELNNFDQKWENIYRDLYYLMGYLEELKKSGEDLNNEINYLDHEGILSNSDIIKNALIRQLPLFLDYVREKYDFKLPYDMDLSVFANNKYIQDHFLSLLSNQLYIYNNLKLYILMTIYTGNSDLMKERVNRLLQDNLIPETLKELEKEAKENLYLRIKEDQQLIEKGLQEGQMQ